ncbi:MAG: flagellar basal body P-ring formation chaperone FlgA [bacterium]
MKCWKQQVICAVKMSRIISLVLIWVVILAFPALAVQKVRAETVIKAAQNELEKNLLWTDRELRVKSRLADRNFPDGRVEFKAGPIKMKKIGGNVLVPVTAYLNGRKYTAFNVLFDVRVYEQALVTARAIKPGEAIAAGDLKLQRTDISALESLPYKNLHDIVGKRAGRYLQAGGILTPDLLENIPLVLKNQTVTVIIANELIKIETLGKALQDGYANDFVSVKLLESKKVLSGRAVSDGIVEVWE